MKENTDKKFIKKALKTVHFAEKNFSEIEKSVKNRVDFSEKKLIQPEKMNFRGIFGQQTRQKLLSKSLADKPDLNQNKLNLNLNPVGTKKSLPKSGIFEANFEDASCTKKSEATARPGIFGGQHFSDIKTPKSQANVQSFFSKLEDQSLQSNQSKSKETKVKKEVSVKKEHKSDSNVADQLTKRLEKIKIEGSTDQKVAVSNFIKSENAETLTDNTSKFLKNNNEKGPKTLPKILNFEVVNEIKGLFLVIYSALEDTIV